ncbi:MFS transporter [Pseudoxanthomonas winnipegensis]|uniref:MFS transporter n=1 Tax=Pseudoxanthomonas winnipegensis TaxID=2480810 RepID=A0A4Q8LAA7_9GAMM|nr:MFS transporter [Pseudoxanthomonas winnipegensis]RZZ82258.1 MFS transporter [Pseudoxanthomonas winnipegensis]RZZ86696.1 MFS transporter [Pseudoxanthomonas winnipegensis]TAA25183.1 MFS transporter [Pseudoxanthomonas winnipegensis]TAA38132.1 MFS transporter [Pseudoxanthomonas winnipegensis]TAA39441.1 MFS transporter [Pseudoxanthomonas winnipegensis]
MSSLSAPNAAVPAGRGGLSIVILAVAAFVIVTTEYLIVGLLPALARDLEISISAAGQLVTLFAFTVMLFGPVLTALLSHVERKRLFVVILLIFAASNALAAIAPNVWVLAVARFIPALALPVFWGTASETAGQIVGPQRAGRAVSQVYLGISAALLFGIPLGTLAADAIGWRGTFWILAGLSLLMALALTVFMPRVARPERLRLAEQTRILKDPFFVANVVLSVVVFTAMFTAYTYLADLLERIAGVAPAHVGWWLMGFGAIGLLGNWLGGRLVDRSPLGATAAFALLLGVGMAASVPLAGSAGLLAGALALWGIAYTALFPICQVRVMQSASHAQALAGTLNVSAANAGTGLGAVIGGLVIPQWGLGSIGYVATGIAVVAILMVAVVARLRER